MSDTIKRTGPRQKKMKTMLECAGKHRPFKQSTTEPNFKGWATNFGKRGERIERSDGSIGKDKTFGANARPGAKEKIRAANRRAKKKARQLMKRADRIDLEEAQQETRLSCAHCHGPVNKGTAVMFMGRAAGKTTAQNNIYCSSECCEAEHPKT